MYGCESWTVKKAECRRIDAFELWCWRRLLRVPWTARRSSQSILKETSPGCSLEGLMLRLKLQYFGHFMWRVDSLEKSADAGRDWGQEEKGMTEDEMAGWHHQLDAHEFGWIPGVGDEQGGLACYCVWSLKNLTRLSVWTKPKHQESNRASTKMKHSSFIRELWNLIWDRNKYISHKLFGGMNRGQVCRKIQSILLERWLFDR